MSNYPKVWNPESGEWEAPKFNLAISKRGNEHFATLEQAEAKLTELLPEYTTGINSKFRVREVEPTTNAKSMGELKRLEIYHSGSGRVWHTVQIHTL